MAEIQDQSGRDITAELAALEARKSALLASQDPPPASQLKASPADSWGAAMQAADAPTPGGASPTSPLPSAKSDAWGGSAAPPAGSPQPAAPSPLEQLLARLEGAEQRVEALFKHIFGA